MPFCIPAVYAKVLKGFAELAVQYMAKCSVPVSQFCFEVKQ